MVIASVIGVGAVIALAVVAAIGGAVALLFFLRKNPKIQGEANDVIKKL